jgi:hypothetical protein
MSANQSAKSKQGSPKCGHNPCKPSAYSPAATRYPFDFITIIYLALFLH